ncbi:MAG: hypothetical protein LH478_16070 [Chitinophagaceae bacterium]|nr:hypothetical protein [Chitinophagaceae bacterium]
MKMQDYTGILPAQYTGKEIAAEASVTLPTPDEAITLFNQGKKRLLLVDKWQKLVGMVSADFCVMDCNGNKTGRAIEKGSLLRIDIPGPRNSDGDGYDWVLVEDLKEIDEDDIQTIAFRVRPTNNPKGNTNNIAHFYDKESTSSFIITRKETTVYANIIDRNIKPNNDTDSIVDNIRNMPVAIGAIGLLSKVQWQSLAEGLLKPE